MSWWTKKKKKLWDWFKPERAKRKIHDVISRAYQSPQVSTARKAVEFGYKKRRQLFNTIKNDWNKVRDWNRNTARKYHQSQRDWFNSYTYTPKQKQERIKSLQEIIDKNKYDKGFHLSDLFASRHGYSKQALEAQRKINMYKTPHSLAGIIKRVPRRARATGQVLGQIGTGFLELANIPSEYARNKITKKSYELSSRFATPKQKQKLAKRYQEILRKRAEDRQRYEYFKQRLLEPKNIQEASLQHGIEGLSNLFGMGEVKGIKAIAKLKNEKEIIKALNKLNLKVDKSMASRIARANGKEAEKLLAEAVKSKGVKEELLKRKQQRMIENLNPEDKKVMTNFIDNTRLRKKNLNAEVEGRELAEILGFEGNNSKIADIFDEILTKQRGPQRVFSPLEKLKFSKGDDARIIKEGLVEERDEMMAKLAKIQGPAKEEMKQQLRQINRMIDDIDKGKIEKYKLKEFATEVKADPGIPTRGMTTEQANLVKSMEEAKKAGIKLPLKETKGKNIIKEQLKREEPKKVEEVEPVADMDVLTEENIEKGLPVEYKGQKYTTVAQKGVYGDKILLEDANGYPTIAPKKDLKITTPEEYILDTLNPTGTVFTEYTPEKRATAKLGKNIKTLAETMKRSPNEEITIYRGAPKTQKEIVPGDFVTTNYDLAKSYSGEGNVLAKKVKLGDVLDDITEPLGEEYIYRPKNLNKVKHAFGGLAGIEVDEDGNIKYNPLTGALGIAGMKMTDKMATTSFGKKIGKEIPYLTKTNKEILKKARANLAKGFSHALKIAHKGGAEGNATAMMLLDDAIKNEAWDTVDMLANEFAPKFAKQGQEIQILSRWGRLTPSGAVNYTKHLLNKVGEETGRKIKPSQKSLQEISNLAKKVQRTKPGTREHNIATAVLMNRIKDETPKNIGKKISTIQTLAQLLNPKTIIRNIIGNMGFAGGEALSDIVGTPIDKLLSVVTKKRTKTLPSLKTQLKGLWKGAKEGTEEALLGIDTKGLSTRMDLPHGSAFDNKIGKGLEKVLSLSLRAPDRALYQAAFDESLRQQMLLNKVKKPTKEMLEIAHQDGLYRTFQDDSRTSRLFSRIKKSLNEVGIKDFGLGDIVLKYPKTPGNLLARALDYSPAGYLKAVLELAKPAFRRQFNQKAFVEALSRGTVGSVGLAGIGAWLGSLGILTAEPTKDRDIRAMEEQQGGGRFRVNISALKRYILSGFDAKEAKKREGDKMLTYDWFQPFAVPLSMGVNAVTKKQGDLSNLATSLTAGAETLVNQPLVSGVQRMFGYGDVVKGLEETAKGIPSSFVPTLLAQIRQLTDNKKRQLRGGSWSDEMVALVKNRLPGFSKTIPPRKATTGEDLEMYKGNGNTLFNVFLNPAFVSTIKTTPEGREVMRMYEESGLTQQAPRLVNRSIILNGKRKELTAEEISKYQEYIGTKTRDAFKILVSSPEFMRMSDEDKAKTMAGIMTDINKMAKVQLFGDKGDVMDVTKKTVKRIASAKYGISRDKFLRKRDERFGDIEQKLRAKGVFKGYHPKHVKNALAKVKRELYYEEIANDIRQKRQQLNDQEFDEYLRIMEENGLLSNNVLKLLQ